MISGSTHAATMRGMCGMKICESVQELDRVWEKELVLSLAQDETAVVASNEVACHCSGQTSWGPCDVCSWLDSEPWNRVRANGAGGVIRSKDRDVSKPNAGGRNHAVPRWHHRQERRRHLWLAWHPVRHARSCTHRSLSCSSGSTLLQQRSMFGGPMHSADLEQARSSG